LPLRIDGARASPRGADVGVRLRRRRAGSHSKARGVPTARSTAAAQTEVCVFSTNRRAPPDTRRSPMLHYAIVFFVIALIAAVFGFGGIAASAVGIGKILFFIFIVLAVLSFVFGMLRKT